MRLAEVWDAVERRKSDRDYMDDKQAWEAEQEELAELMAEVIAQKKARLDWKEHKQYGPGMITDIELNLEKIYDA
jgi:hypothetical protein